MNSTGPPLTEEYINTYLGLRLVVIVSLFLSLEVIFVSLRLYSRYLSKSKTGLDDFLIWPALVACLVLNALALVMVKFCGVGRHAAALSFIGESYKLVLWAKGITAMVPLYLLAVTLPKLCVLVLYLRIFIQPAYRITCYVLVALVIGNWIGGTVALLVSCIPLAKIWNPALPGHCINSNVFYRWISFPNLVSDVVILALPLPLVWSLHTTINQKLGLTITFSAGGIGLIISIVRFTNFFARNAYEDPTMTSVDLMTWTVIEPGMYLIASCLVTLRPLLHHILKEHFMGTFLGRPSRGYEISSSNNDNKKPRVQKSGPSPVNSMALRDLRSQSPSFGDDTELAEEYIFDGKVGAGTKSDCISSPKHGDGFGNHQIHVEQNYSVTLSRS